MAIEIIEAGTLPAEHVFVTRCHTCKTKFRFTRADARPVKDQRDGGYLSIQCALRGCHEMLSVDASAYEGAPKRTSQWGDR